MRTVLFALVLLSLAQLATAQSTGNPEAGKTLWEGVETQCRNCHGPEGQGAFGPDLAGRALTPAQFAQAVRKPWGIMPAYPEQLLSNQQLTDVAAYMASLPTVAEPGAWRFAVPAGAPRGQELLLATIGCGQCHGLTFNGPRADAGAIDADFAWFKEMVYNHATVMPQHRELVGEDPYFVRMGNYAPSRIPESLLEEIWQYVHELGFRAAMAARLGSGTPGSTGVTYPLTVENIGLPGRGVTAEDVTILVSLPSGTTVAGTTGEGYQGVSHDQDLGTDVAVWRIPRMGPKDRLSYSITLAQAPSGQDTLRGVVRWARPAVVPDAERDQANIAPPPSS